MNAIKYIRWISSRMGSMLQMKLSPDERLTALAHSRTIQGKRNSGIRVLFAGVPILAFVAAALTVILWASAFPGIRAGLQAFSPAQVALLRYGVASGVLAIFAIAARLPLPRLRDVPGIALTGAIGIALYNLLLNAGEVHTPSAVASFIVASAPVFMAVESRLFLKEQLRPWGWAGILLSFAGVAVIAFGARRAGAPVDFSAFLVLGAALAQSIYFVAQKPYLRRYTAVQYTAYAVWAGTLLLLPFAPGLVTQLRVAPQDATLAVVYLGIFPGALGYVVWAYALARLSAATAGSFLYLVPACAIGLAFLWLGELPSLLSMVGGIVVILGVIVVNTLGKQQQTAISREETAVPTGARDPL
jgi:drug/metabolite transporter (DMT)-like permease